MKANALNNDNSVFRKCEIENQRESMWKIEFRYHTNESEQTMDFFFRCEINLGIKQKNYRRDGKTKPVTDIIMQSVQKKIYIHILKDTVFT